MESGSSDQVSAGSAGSHVAGRVITSSQPLKKKAKNQYPGKFRAYCLTLWNDEQLDFFMNSNFQYFCWAPETCPETGKFHWQAFVYYTNQVSWNALIEKCPNCRIEPSKALDPGPANRTYIFGPYFKDGKYKPPNPEAKELGKMPKRGDRVDIEDMMNGIKSGKRGLTLSEDHYSTQAKYMKFAEHITCLYDQKQAHEDFRDGKFPQVHVLWGEPGVGKTRYVYDKFISDTVYTPTIRKDGTTWWTNYNGQEIILLDEFYGQMPVSEFLRLTDRYPYQMETKGGHTWRKQECQIWITSNRPPSTWYPEFADIESAVSRRFTTCTEMKKDE